MSTASITRSSALRGTLVVYRRELAAVFDSSVAYVYLIGALLLSCALFMNEFFLTARLDMAPFFDALAPISALLLPALTMRLWAEDLKTRTFELWMTLPLAAWQVVVGKYLAALTVWVVFLLGTLPIVVMLTWLGEPDLGLIASGYVGALLLGGLFLAIGLFASALSSDQVVAFVTSVAICALLLATGHPKVIAVLDGQLSGLGRGLAGTVSALPPYEELTRGLVSLASLVWFGGLSATFLGLNAAMVARSRS
jgi:ABC-2 type transport system permease protein